MYIASELDLVKDQIHNNIEDPSNYQYLENCPYQMSSGIFREVDRVYPDVQFSGIEIIIQLEPKETA